MKQYQYLLFILLSGSFSFLASGCSKDDEQNNLPAVNTLAQVISQDTSLSMFQAALNRTHLITFATGPGPYTIFAPTNSAYRKLGVQSAADLANIDSSLLMQQTTYLIAAGELEASTYLVGNNILTLTTQSGTTVFGQNFNNEVYFNGGKSVKTDIPASNGRLYAMDEYLIPTNGTTSGTLGLNSGNFKLFLQAATRASLTAAGSGINRSTTTLFAPTNAAMTAAGLDSLAITKTPVPELVALVKYHTLGAVNFRYALSNATYRTEQGGNISLNLTGTPTITGNKGSASITGFNLVTSNGVIHTINAVLRP